MTREELIEEGREQAYYDIADDVVSHLQSLTEDVVADYRFIDFSDEVFALINKEKLENQDTDIVYDIVKPAEEEISRRIRKALFHDEY